MIAYVDSSVVLQNVLENDTALFQAMDYPQVFSSELIYTECNRVLYRLSCISHIDELTLVHLRQKLLAILDGLVLIPLLPDIKALAASPFPTVIGTLDALHLSSALILHNQLEDDVSVFTYDRQLNICAAASGLLTPFFDCTKPETV